ncbi:MAG: succinyl-diaminopimelate desuccinylase, partial [Limnohabitans sp.]
CMDIIADALRPLGFVCEFIDSGPETFRVRNLWAKRPGRSSQTLAFAGHTDVVPTGPLAQWTSDPFTPSHREGKLHGRGASDMKTSLAAMVVAVQEFLASTPEPDLGLAFLLTSDEEGPAVDGTVIVCERLQARGEAPQFCIVGEPTSVERTGDMIKNGRRGTMSGKLTVKGVQGHIAYPHLADNPIHRLAPALAELVSIRWDEGNAFFPPTSWQVSNIHAGTGASNVIPGECVVDFNFRFCTESTTEALQQRLQAVLDRHGLQYELKWTIGGLPFLTTPGTLVGAIEQAIADETGLRTELSTTGGTSDGRFIAQICPQVIEFGPPNATIHKVNEHVALSDIAPLKGIYRRTLDHLNTGLRA